MNQETLQNCPCQGKTLMRFVQPMILAMLSREPCHGYILIQKIAATKLWRGAVPDPAGIYRTLREMEGRGLITSREDQKAGSGMSRRIFSLTDIGAACQQNWLHTLRRYQEGIDEIIQMLA